MEKPAPVEELGGEGRLGNVARGRSRESSIAMVLAAVVGAAVVAVAWAGVARFAEPPAIPSGQGPLNVHYTIQTTPTSSEGSTITNVSRIEFHPGYVVVKRNDDGGGQVFFNEHTLSLRWSR